MFMLLRNKTLTLFLIFGLTVLQLTAQEEKVAFSTEDAIAADVKLAPCESKERHAAVIKLFKSVGAKDDEVAVEEFDKGKIRNIVVKKAGNPDETIVIGAHYDKTADGCGAIDNWTGIVILAHIYKSISAVKTNKSYVFVAFDEEEKGLRGSAEMVKAIPKEDRKAYCSMVNFDSFGFTMPWILRNTSDSKLTKSMQKHAESAKIKLADAEIENADADSSSFKSNGIPAVTLSGLNGDWRNYLHSSGDKLAQINMNSVYLGYRVGLFLISKLDADVCREPGKK